MKDAAAGPETQNRVWVFFPFFHRPFLLNKRFTDLSFFFTVSIYDGLLDIQQEIF